MWMGRVALSAIAGDATEMEKKAEREWDFNFSPNPIGKHAQSKKGMEDRGGGVT
jgi:hypothetical protein